MLKFLQIVGALSLVFICIGVIGFGVLAFQVQTLNKESKSYVDAATQAIIDTWSEQQLEDRESPDFRKNTTPDQLAAFFDTLSTLGPIIEYDGSKGNATFGYTTKSGVQISALYVANAKFQNGSAIFRIALVKLKNNWMIEGFHVDPTLSNNE